MAKEDANEDAAPPGVVFITIGFMVVLLAAAVLFINPSIAQSASANAPLPVITVVITPIPDATAEAATAEENSTEITLPAGFVSLKDAPRGSLDHQPRRIVIPNIEVDAPVVDVSLTAVENEGQPGNTVLNGHHNIHGEVIGALVDLETGDEIIVYDKFGPHHYTVADVQILPERDQPLEVRKENATWIQPTDDERLTLVTCWPHTDNTHRLIVVAYPAESSSN